METLHAATWRSPSNIALIKYWGKCGDQIPCNPSLSFSLANCYTDTSLELVEKQTGEGIDLDFYFDGKPNENFKKRIVSYFDKIKNTYTFLQHYKLVIKTSNSFPHSAGIASSASAFSALALCVQTLHDNLSESQHTASLFYQKSSDLARQGSGSAARSVYGAYSLWGNYEAVEPSSNSYAVPYAVERSFFSSLQDTILIVNNQQKSTSSSLGHALMNNHPYARTRYQVAHENLKNILSAIKAEDFSQFSKIVEHEALGLHGLMMMADPWYTLLSPDSIKAIQLIKTFRNDTNLDITFTLDAGPNVHLIYPESIKEKVVKFVESDLKPLCANQQVIYDKIGKGPLKRSSHA